MNQYSEYQAKIEDILEKILPKNFTNEWQKETFGDLDSCVGEKHFEPLVKPCRNLLSLGGKRWRPLMMVLASALKTSNGEPSELAYNLTPLVEYVHTASLIHDDIEDNADMRRGMPCAHISFGLDTAINAGSWLYFQAFTAIQKSTEDTKLKEILQELLSRELRRLHLGQAMDIEWHKNNNSLPTSEEYMAMVRMKTGTLASLAAQVGLIAGGGTPEEGAFLGKIAADIGVAFQIHDDVINLTTGNKGKKRGDDIVEGKKSMPILLHLQENPEDFSLIMEYFQQAAKEGIESPAVEKCIELVGKNGAIEKAQIMADNLKAKAINDIKENWKGEAALKLCGLFEKL